MPSHTQNDASDITPFKKTTPSKTRRKKMRHKFLGYQRSGQSQYLAARADEREFFAARTRAETENIFEFHIFSLIKIIRVGRNFDGGFFRRYKRVQG